MPGYLIENGIIIDAFVEFEGPRKFTLDSGREYYARGSELGVNIYFDKSGERLAFTLLKDCDLFVEKKRKIVPVNQKEFERDAVRKYLETLPNRRKGILESIRALDRSLHSEASPLATGEKKIG